MVLVSNATIEPRKLLEWRERLEAAPWPPDRAAQRRLVHERRLCYGALEWEQVRDRGAQHYVWRRGRVMIECLVAFGPMVAVVSFGSAAAVTTARVASAVALGALTFGSLVAVGYLAWWRHEREYKRLVATLPAASGTTHLAAARR